MQGTGELLIGMAVLLNAIVAAVTYFHARRTAAAIAELAINTNSIKDALIVTTRDDAHAKGVLQGRQEAEKERK